MEQKKYYKNKCYIKILKNNENIKIDKNHKII